MEVKRIVYSRSAILSIREKCSSFGFTLARKVKRKLFYFRLLKRRIPIQIGHRPSKSSVCISHRGRSTSNLIRVQRQQVPRPPRHQLPVIFLSNVCSAFNKVDEMSLLLSQHEVDIAVVVETWLSPSTPDAAVSIDGFNLIRADRERRNGGGRNLFSVYIALIRPILLYAFPAVCNMSGYLRNRLENVEKRIFRIINCERKFPSLFSVGDKICQNMFFKVMNNVHHPLRQFFNDNSYSSIRNFCPLRKPKSKTKRFANSFIRYCK